MDPYADMGCLLKVNAQCEACKMKMVEVLSSIRGVYSVNINAEEGTVKVSGEVDPNILLRALARSGKHAELVWVKLKHPALNRSYYDNDYGSHGSHGYGSIDEPFRYNRGLPESSWYQPHQHYPRRRRPIGEYPWYNNNYH